MEPLILDYNINERIANRNGNRNPCAVPHAAFRCSGEDRWCAIAIYNDEDGGNFVRLLVVRRGLKILDSLPFRQERKMRTNWKNDRTVDH